MQLEVWSIQLRQTGREAWAYNGAVHIHFSQSSNAWWPDTKGVPPRCP